MLTICTQTINRIFRLKCIAILAGAACGRRWANTGWFPDHVRRTHSIWNAVFRSYLIRSWPIGRSINVEGENAHRNCIVLLHSLWEAESSMFLAEYFRHNLLLNTICMHFLCALSLFLPDRLTRIIVFVKSVLMWNASLACKQASCFEHLVILFQASYYSLVHSAFNPQLVHKLLPMNTFCHRISVSKIKSKINNLKRSEYHSEHFGLYN